MIHRIFKFSPYQKMSKKDYYLFFIFILSLFTACVNTKSVNQSAMDKNETPIRYDDTRPGHWPEPFEEIKIVSTLDSAIQKAWFYKPKDTTPRPLLISLHTWSGDYNQKDTLVKMVLEKDWIYIHPDFRGPNWTSKACCSKYALEDIDQAIDFAIAHANVDTSRIYVNGVSGGGYAALAVYMRSRHPIHTISAWVPISDLAAWFNQSRIRKNGYSDHILACTGSAEKILNVDEAIARSPIYWRTPIRETRLHIYAGVYDGIQGSVPITQSINFYNKLVKDFKARDQTDQINERDEGALVQPEEILYLLEHRKPLKNMGVIGDRKICLQKEHNNISLIIFEGNHEMLPEVAFEILMND